MYQQFRQWENKQQLTVYNMKEIIGFLLFVIALVLIFLMTIVNFFEVKHKKGYFRSTAINLDIWGNVEFRTFWNNHIIKETLINPFGYQGETISSVLGKNILTDNLTNAGKVLVWILTEKHCIDAINTN
jgi:hypothetical protein